MNTKAAKDKVSFILYEDNKIPRYHQFKPQVYKFLIYGPTILTMFSVLVLVGTYFYTKNVEKHVRSKEPEMIKLLRTENALVKERSSELTILNKRLTQKLSAEVPKTPLAALNFISPVSGQKDLTNPARINIQDIKVETVDKKLHVRFNIVNVTPENTKLSGYIHLFVTDGNSIQRYPSEVEEIDTFNLSYNSGESFATSRFRPVEAVFPTLPKKSNVFKIIIFNRLGDLIHQQQFKQQVNR
ncbi:MAG: hypothetical protein BM556_12585 [Bacteriovorax sp. MedPE-SWde]|nr:MAG: hypothetical protein BM556_12585 [Bacteriovorax sp. MedPE-SWde]